MFQFAYISCFQVNGGGYGVNAFVCLICYIDGAGQNTLKLLLRPKMDTTTRQICCFIGLTLTLPSRKPLYNHWREHKTAETVAKMKDRQPCSCPSITVMKLHFRHSLYFDVDKNVKERNLWKLGDFWIYRISWYIPWGDRTQGEINFISSWGHNL